MAQSIYIDFFPRSFDKWFSGGIDWLTHTIKVSLHSWEYDIDPDSHMYLSDVTNEVNGSGYTFGGVTLTGKSISYTAGPPREVRLGASVPSWSNLTSTGIQWAIVYRSTGVASTSPLIGYGMFDTIYNPLAQTFSIDWLKSGMLAIRF